jgi:importin subunit beta-1
MHRSNQILTAVVQGARKEEPSPDVQLAAIHALFNSLEFVRDNFDREASKPLLSISSFVAYIIYLTG